MKLRLDYNLDEGKTLGHAVLRYEYEQYKKIGLYTNDQYLDALIKFREVLSKCEEPIREENLGLPIERVGGVIGKIVYKDNSFISSLIYDEYDYLSYL